MRVIAVDPGTEQSAFLTWDGARVVAKEILPNADLLRWVRSEFEPGALLAIEQVESYGMPVGREVFETVWWAGRFAEAHHERGGNFRMVPRRLAKMHLCHSNRADDSAIRQALIDRFGHGRGAERAIGNKAAPGPLYGVHKHEWAALAIAVTVFDECESLPITPNIIDHREGAA